jgi:hypothetical protein
MKMRQEICYVANDGKRFLNEQECMAYELSASGILSGVQLFDQQRELLNWHDADMYDIYYFKCADVSAVVGARLLFRYLGEDNPFEQWGANDAKLVGTWFYDQNTSEWQHLESVLAHYKTMADDLNQ